MSKKKDKGRINPGERDEEATRAFDKRQQKEAAKIEMVYKLGQRKKGGKYTRPAPGASKATDTESALNTFEVQKMFDRDQKAGKGPGIDLISDRRLASKEGSMKTGGLTGRQKKLDKNKNNRIDAEDFKILRGGRAAMKARMGSRVPQVIRPKPTVGGKPLTPKPIKPKPKPKMGGGMMKKYSKGGGADTGRVGELKSKIAVATDKLKKHFQKRKRRPDYIKPPERKPMIPAGVGQVAQSLTPTGIGKQMGRKLMGKMGGGMMKRPMGYKKGKEIDYGKVFDKKFYSSALGKEAQLHADDYDAGLDRAERRAASETMALMKKNKKMGKMGGGMMMKPMGYKSLTSL